MPMQCYDQSSSPGLRWWIKDIFKQGIGHMVYALGLWLVLNALFNPDYASIGTALYFMGREMRDFEIEAFPYYAFRIGTWVAENTPFVALGYSLGAWNGLRSATQWNHAQLRHSLSGWVPVVLACIVLLIVL